VSEWREVTLGELLTVKHGYAFKGEHFVPSGEEVVLTPGNFRIGGGLQLRDGKERYYVGAYPKEFQLSPGSLLVVMTDLTQDAPILGSPAFIPESPAMLHNQRLGLVQIEDHAEVDRRFLFYLLLADTTRSQVRATATGSTVRHTAPGRIRAVRVKVPSLSVQRNIGEILGAMDDLIENNRLRIELLEQMAQAIYLEWFVRFRYPGHEDANFVDSPLGPIPEGWEATTIGAVAELRYGKALKAANRRGGSVAVVGSSAVVGWHDESLVAGPAIVVGRKGNVGNVIWVPGPCWPIDTAYYVSTDLPLQYVRDQLTTAEFINTHAAVPGLSRDQAYSLPFLLPPTALMAAYSEVSDTLGGSVESLRQQLNQLASIRDLLLPKLVTGEIDVSPLDLDAVVESVA
jgi:type I restriction enzyme S subunit